MAAAREAPPDLVQLFALLANPTRVALLHRLQRPAFVPELADELGLTRQAVTKHLDALREGGVVRRRATRRGLLRAMEYAADPGGLFAFQEAVRALGVPPAVVWAGDAATRPADAAGAAVEPSGPGLLLVHGDRRGRWWTLAGDGGWAIGRDARNEIALPYDPFASARHALLARDGAAWTLTDLGSRNGTELNFRPLPPGASARVAPGDLVGVGRSLLLLRGPVA